VLRLDYLNANSVYLRFVEHDLKENLKLSIPCTYIFTYRPAIRTNSYTTRTTIQQASQNSRHLSMWLHTIFKGDIQNTQKPFNIFMCFKCSVCLTCRWCEFTPKHVENFVKLVDCDSSCARVGPDNICDNPKHFYRRHACDCQLTALHTEHIYNLRL
jgi:hypothetical protein